MNKKERLTERAGNGVQYATTGYLVKCYPENNNLSPVDKMAVKLCDLEDKIEDGTLIELPCKVGQNVWCIVDGVSFNPIEAKIYSITLQAEGIIMRCGLKGYFGVSYMAQDLGKKFFTVKEEAEKAAANRRLSK